MIGKLGRRPPKNAPALRLSSILTGAIPDHPLAADHFAKVPKWILGGNDTYGDCGPVSVANERLLVTTYLTDKPHIVSQEAIFDLYRRSGNPNFDPNDPGGPGDGGVDMQTMLEAVASGGIDGEKCVAFAKVDVGNVEEVEAAIAIFGSNLLGVNLLNAQQAQTDKGLWDYVPTSGEWGGHAVLNGRYRDQPDQGAVVTWATVVDFTDAFEQNQVDEAWVVIWKEHFGNAAFLAGIDTLKLAALFKTMTGRDLPIPTPTPTPTPTPQPAGCLDAADKLLFGDLKVLGWLTARHSGTNRKAAQAVQAWAKSKGLM